jgi:hypothetical protein
MGVWAWYRACPLCAFPACVDRVAPPSRAYALLPLHRLRAPVDGRTPAGHLPTNIHPLRANSIPAHRSLLACTRRLARITQTGLPAQQPAAIPDPGALASSDGAQNSTWAGRAGRWLAPGGVSCLTFISRPSPPRRTHRPCCLCFCPSGLAVGLAFTLLTSVRRLRVKLRRPRYCIIHPHPRLLRPDLLDRILRPPPRPQ